MFQHGGTIELLRLLGGTKIAFKFKGGIQVVVAIFPIHVNSLSKCATLTNNTHTKEKTKLRNQTRQLIELYTEALRGLPGDGLETDKS